MVILQESGTTPTKWPLGQVLETNPGQDDLIRVVTLKTAHGVCLQETGQQDSSSNTKDRHLNYEFSHLW